MNHSGDAAEQIVRLSLEGIEVAARITGTAAKEIATFIAAALKSGDNKLKLKGKARMTSMLKSGKALEIFSVKESDLQKFYRGAKQYGIVYCVLRNRKNTPDKDGWCDILVKADDAPKISRLAERFKFATIDKAKIESEIIRQKAEQARNAEQQADAGQPAPDRDDTDKLLDELLGTDEGKAAPEKQPEAEKPDASKTAPAKEAPQNPSGAKTEKSLPSEPISESRNKSAEGTLSKKPSVLGDIREIKAARKAKAEAEAPRREDKAAAKPKANSSTTHKQPQNTRKSKPKSKER
jgi:hypothetical protein